MDAFGVARVLASRALWTKAGLRPAGRHLVRALGSEDEDVRTLAGMSLVQAGKRSEALLEEALERREHLPIVLTILGSDGGRNPTIGRRSRLASSSRDPYDCTKVPRSRSNPRSQTSSWMILRS